MTAVRRGQVVLAMALAIVIGSPVARAGQKPSGAAPPQLQNTAPSMDTLIARFLGALAKKDRKELQRLRVNEREYVGIIMPGSVAPGKAQQTFAGEKAKYFWGVLNEKSVYSEMALLNTHGGRRYKVTDVSWAKGIKQFDGYTGYAQLRLTVQDEKGEFHEIETGSVAEIGGRYKFVSYVRD